MSGLGLGWEPYNDDIVLTHGDWFLERSPGTPLPPGTTARIEWANDVTWTGVVDGSWVKFRQDKATCTAAIIPNGTRYEMWITYPNQDTPEDPDEHVWRRGSARRIPATN